MRRSGEKYSFPSPLLPPLISLSKEELVLLREDEGMAYWGRQEAQCLWGFFHS